MALRSLFIFSDVLSTNGSVLYRCCGRYKPVNGFSGRHSDSGRLFRSSPGKNVKPQEARRDITEGIQVESGPVAAGKLIKPLCFTVGFSATCFAGAAIWQYETMRMHAQKLIKRPVGWFYNQQKKMAQSGQEITSFWNSLRDSEKIFIPICLANIIVFAAWRIPRLQPAMVKYFCSNPASKVICWPMMLSTFSHYSVFHLLANMYVLHSFSYGALSSLGKEQFLALYLSAGVFSTFASYACKVFSAQAGLSLGASGAIMAILGYVCCQYPETKLSIIFLPMYTFSAGSAIKVIMGLDLAGVIMGWKFFDHAAHLGGAAFGIMWCLWGNAYIWQKREPFIQYWHHIRTNTPR